MADNQQGLYLLAYDIANPKRLSRVHRVLKRQGLPVQYSVFTLVMKRKSLLRLLATLDALINPVKDDIRCYRLPIDVNVITLGRQLFPGDVWLFSNGVNVLIN